MEFGGLGQQSAGYVSQLLPATCLEHANFKKFIIATFHITYQAGTVQDCISYQHLKFLDHKLTSL